MRPLLLLGLLVATPAAAQSLLVTTSDGADALRRVTEATGQPATAFTIAPLASLVDRSGPLLRGPGDVKDCRSEPATGAEVQTSLEELEGWARGGASEGLVRLADGLHTRIGCLVEPVDPDVLARADGLLRTLRGTPAPAGDTPVPVGFTPGLPAGVWLDGQSVAGAGTSTTPGTHLLQWEADGIHSLWLTTRTEEVTVYFPDLLFAARDGMGDPEVREVLGILAGRTDPPLPIYVADGSVLWAVWPRERRWEPILPPPPPPVTASKKRTNTPLWLIGTGIAAAVLGGTFAMVGDYDAQTCSTPAECDRATARRTAGQVVLGAGAGVTVGGTVWFAARPAERVR